MSECDRKRGTLLGLAVGDALGAAVEFQMPGTFDEVTGYRGGGPYGLASGQRTDDSSMALALADSITNAGWDLNDQAGRYALFVAEGGVFRQRPLLARRGTVELALRKLLESYLGNTVISENSP